MLPKVSSFLKLEEDLICRLDGGPLGSKYSVSTEITDFRGVKAWCSNFSLAALAESFEEVVPEKSEVIGWLQNLCASELRVTRNSAGTSLLNLETEIDGVGTMRLPPTGSFAEVTGRDAGDLSNSIGLQLYETAQARSTRAEIVAGAGMHKYHQANASAVTSPTMASDDVAADTRASPTAPEPLGPADEDSKVDKSSDDDVAPIRQAKRVKARGRGRGFRL